MNRPLVVLALLVPALVFAQPRCKKGCACGNACISCSKVCRISGGSAASPPALPIDTPTTRPAAKVTAPTFALINHELVWAGSVVNKLYFLETCVIAKVLPGEDRIAIQDTIAYAKLSFKRLIAPGC